MLTEAVLVAIVTVLGGILVELIRTRKKATAAAEGASKVMHEFTPNSGQSMRDAIGRIEKSVDEVKGSVRELRRDLSGHAERLAAVEAIVGRNGRARY